MHVFGTYRNIRPPDHITDQAPNDSMYPNTRPFRPFQRRLHQRKYTPNSANLNPNRIGAADPSVCRAAEDSPSTWSRAA